MRFKENIKDFIAIVKEYKKFFVPKYCSAATFYLFLVIMLILPRKLFTLPGNGKDDKSAKDFFNSLSEEDQKLLKEMVEENLSKDAQRAKGQAT